VGLAEASHVNYLEGRPTSSLRRDGKLQTQPKGKGTVAILTISSVVRHTHLQIFPPLEPHKQAVISFTTSKYVVSMLNICFISIVVASIFTINFEDKFKL
jgi:hypothetical protein